MVTKSELLAVQDKTNRHLRLREYLLEHSANSDLVCDFFMINILKMEIFSF